MRTRPRAARPPSLSPRKFLVITIISILVAMAPFVRARLLAKFLIIAIITIFRAMVVRMAL